MSESIQPPRDSVAFFRQGLLLIAATLLLIIVAFALYSVRRILLFFLIGLGLGAVIQPILPYLKRKLRIPYAASAFLLFIVLLLVIGGGTIAISQLLVDEISPLLAQLPNRFSAGMDQLAMRFEAAPAVQEALREFNVDVTDYIPQVTSSALAWLRFGGSTLIYGLFVVAVSLYAAVDSERYKAGFLAILPARHRRRAELLLRESGTTLRQWIAAQGIIMFCVSAMTAVALLLIGMPDWPLYAMLAGVLNIIPYVGPFITAGILVVISLGVDPTLTIWVLLSFAVIQEVESYLLTPLVMRGQIKLPPIYLLTLIFVMGHWFGLLGVFAASPVLAVLRRLVVILHIPRMNRLTN